MRSAWMTRILIKYGRPTDNSQKNWVVGRGMEEAIENKYQKFQKHLP